jgi:hypothetical protein
VHTHTLININETNKQTNNTLLLVKIAAPVLEANPNLFCHDITDGNLLYWFVSFATTLFNFLSRSIM